MNIKFLLIVGALLFSTLCFAKRIPTHGRWECRSKSIVKEIPIEASFEESSKELLLQFHDNLGLVYVTVTNSLGEVVHNEAVEVSNALSFVIRLNDTVKGEYTLLITDGRNEAYGEFSII